MHTTDVRLEILDVRCNKITRPTEFFISVENMLRIPDNVESMSSQSVIKILTELIIVSTNQRTA
ncbi:hypothetical protein [uncultured Pseudodesulfovibrio sp.]|uniref:hypothetical protein n=1 Tax=uncultured Pseudodesulfovibrio sp. TaxID=2035858 RepID=UPI00374842C4